MDFKNFHIFSYLIIFCCIFRPFLYEGYGFKQDTEICDFENNFTVFLKFSIFLIVYCYNFNVFRYISKALQNLKENLQNMVILFYFPILVSILWGLYIFFQLLQWSLWNESEIIKTLKMIARISPGIMNLIIYKKMIVNNNKI